MKICFLNGPFKDTEFIVKKNLILNRNNPQKNEIAIKDPKASNPHAKIIKDKKNFYLQDMNSKNGIYVNNKMNSRFVITPGLQFTIGNTVFLVKPEFIPPKPWVDIVSEELNKLSLKDTPKKWTIIKPALILEFQSGVQKGVKWFIYYGPRKAGTQCLDLPILEHNAPDICFSLEPKNCSVLFKTQYPDKVLINKTPISQKQLVSGDVITFISTSIKVLYENT